ncbi:hypothetical protein HYV86_00120 [Candidatus Woesearchaeota archaeon]|nr:hypothetical protein [Candidatus Woesearchaeota archaeon]
MALIKMSAYDGTPVSGMERDAAHVLLRHESESGDYKHKDHHVQMFLMTPEGIYIPKRSDQAADNQGQYEMSFGTHQLASDLSLLKTVLRVREELGLDIVEMEYKDWVCDIQKGNNIYLRRLAMIPTFLSERVDPDGKSWMNVTHEDLVLGYTYAPLPNVASEHRLYTTDELLKDIQTSPEKFTGDVRKLFMLNHNALRDLEQRIK